jgi:hypothetical protein
MAILFLKARDRGDTDTGDMFGTHVEQRTRKDGVTQGYRVKAKDLPPNRFKGMDPVKATPDMFAGPPQSPAPTPAPAAEPAIPDGHSKKFYVTMIRDPGPRQRVARLAGPFDEHEHALAHVEPARKLAVEVDPRAHFDAFGTAGVTAAEHRPGVLNERLGIGAPAADPDAALLDGFPQGSHFIAGKGILGSGKWAVAGPDGRMIGNLMATKRDAAQEARGFLRSRELAAAAAKELEEHYAHIADKLRAGKDLTDVDLKALGLKPGRARFDYLSPVVQRLFGISRAKVRAAMGDALSQSFSDMGTPSWWANPRKALANAAAYASGATPALTKALFLRRP